MKCYLPHGNKICPPHAILPPGTLTPNSIPMARNMKRSIQIRTGTLTTSCAKNGRPGLPGPPGPPGLPGRDGRDGKNGKNGKNGFNGFNGRPGKDGKDGATGPAGFTPSIITMPITPEYNYPITLQTQIGYINSFLLGTNYSVLSTTTLLESQSIPLGVWLVELTANFTIGTSVAQLGLSTTYNIDSQKTTTGISAAGTLRLTTIISNIVNTSWNILAISSDSSTYNNLYITLTRIA